MWYIPSSPVVPAAPCRRHPALSAVNLSSVAAEPVKGHRHTWRGLNTVQCFFFSIKGIKLMKLKLFFFVVFIK